LMRHAALLVRLSLRNVFRNRRHSLFALGTIAIGATGLLVYMGFNRGTMDQYKADTIRSRWGHGQLFVRGYRETAHTRPWEMWIEHPQAVMDRVRRLPGVADVFPRVGIPGLLVAGDRMVAGQGEGIDGVREARFFDQLRYLEGGDFKDNSSGIVMGKGIAEALGVHVGDKIQVVTGSGSVPSQRVTVSLTGVFHTGIQEFDNRAFRIPLPVAQGLMGTDRVELLAIALATSTAWPGFAHAARTALPDLEVVPFDELDKVYYRHSVDWLDAQFAFIKSIILFIVFLGILNAVSMTVVERTAEIGMLRANGESRIEIAITHVIEAAALGLVGGCLGLIGAWALAIGPLRHGVAMPPAPGLTRGLRIVIGLGLRDAMGVLALCLVTSIAGCLLPVWRTTRTPIAQALRHS